MRAEDKGGLHWHIDWPEGTGHLSGGRTFTLLVVGSFSSRSPKSDFLY
jgi:hypothetical protein